MKQWYEGDIPENPFDRPMPPWARIRIERGWLREIESAVRQGRLTPDNIDGKTSMLLAEIMVHGRTDRIRLKAVGLALALQETRKSPSACAPPPVPPESRGETRSPGPLPSTISEAGQEPCKFALPIDELKPSLMLISGPDEASIVVLSYP